MNYYLLANIETHKAKDRFLLYLRNKLLSHYGIYHGFILLIYTLYSIDIWVYTCW